MAEWMPDADQRWRGAGRRAWVMVRSLVVLLTAGGAFACGSDTADTEGTRIADVEATAGGALEVNDAGVRVAGAGSLARAAGGEQGTDYRVQVITNPGVVIGAVGGGASIDTSITPTHDLSVCRPFSQSLVPSRNGGVGNAVVWLSGVSTGPRDDAPRRAKLTLDGCRLEPRVQRLAMGTTVLLNGRDAMMSRLQFTADGEREPRATALLSDVGQVVPIATASAAPGLVRVSDDMHPWVRAWLVVAPHPFVAVTDADGQFRFDGVPPGRYTLHVWHERFGTKEQKVRVESGVQVRVELGY